MKKINYFTTFKDVLILMVSFPFWLCMKIIRWFLSSYAKENMEMDLLYAAAQNMHEFSSSELSMIKRIFESCIYDRRTVIEVMVRLNFDLNKTEKVIKESTQHALIPSMILDDPKRLKYLFK